MLAARETGEKHEIRTGTGLTGVSRRPRIESRIWSAPLCGALDRARWVPPKPFHPTPSSRPAIQNEPNGATTPIRSRETRHVGPRRRPQSHHTITLANRTPMRTQSDIQRAAELLADSFLAGFGASTRPARRDLVAAIAKSAPLHQPLVGETPRRPPADRAAEGRPQVHPAPDPAPHPRTHPAARRRPQLPHGSQHRHLCSTTLRKASAAASRHRRVLPVVTRRPRACAVPHRRLPGCRQRAEKLSLAFPEIEWPAPAQSRIFP